MADLGSVTAPLTETLGSVGVTQRLAQLDADAARKWPWLHARGRTASLRMIVVYQAIALIEIFMGIATGNGIVTGLAAGPLVLGIGAAWRLLYPPADGSQ